MRHFRNRQKSGRSRLYQVGMCRGTGLLLPQLQPETEEDADSFYLHIDPLTGAPLEAL